MRAPFAIFLLAASPLGCGIVLGIDDPPALRGYEDTGADGTIAVDTTVEDDTAIDTTVAETETSANDGVVEAEVDAWAGLDGNLLLYRSSDGAAVLTRVDETGAALPPRALTLPAGFCSVAYVHEEQRAHDVVDLPAPIALLAGTMSEQLIIHQGDALVTGHLTTKGSDRAFVSDHRYDTGALAKSWTSMVYLADPSP